MQFWVCRLQGPRMMLVFKAWRWRVRRCITAAIIRLRSRRTNSTTPYKVIVQPYKGSNGTDVRPRTLSIASFNAAHFQFAAAIEHPQQCAPFADPGRGSRYPEGLRISANGKALASFSGAHLSIHSSSTILAILLKADADLIALQNVKADESDNMRPLSDLAHALGMHFVFTESWAPQFGHAILSRWPVKFQHEHVLNGEYNRKLLQVVVDVPRHGELQICTTHLDHLDEKLRLQEAQSLVCLLKGVPHILAANLNALDASDYSKDRWNDIDKMRLSNGKPPARAHVMEFLKHQLGYHDCKDYAGEPMEAPVVILPPGQDVEGTCKEGTRVDYILASACLPYTIVPGSYTVISSRGTSDHHLLRLEIESIFPGEHDCLPPEIQVR